MTQGPQRYGSAGGVAVGEPPPGKTGGVAVGVPMLGATGGVAVGPPTVGSTGAVAVGIMVLVGTVVGRRVGLGGGVTRSSGWSPVAVAAGVADGMTIDVAVALGTPAIGPLAAVAVATAVPIAVAVSSAVGVIAPVGVMSTTIPSGGKLMVRPGTITIASRQLLSIIRSRSSPSCSARLSSVSPDCTT